MPSGLSSEKWGESQASLSFVRGHSGATMNLHKWLTIAIYDLCSVCEGCMVR